MTEYEEMMPEQMASKTSFHNMEKTEFEARLQDVKQCSIPDFGV